MSSDCIFCAIVSGDAEASFVAESERAVAFLDLRPVGEGHTLVIPRRHAGGLSELDPADGAAVFELGQRVAAAQYAAGLAEGVNLFLADGVVAGQEVFHVHLHVLARRPGDALRMHIEYGAPPTRPELDSVASTLRDALGEQGPTADRQP